MYSPRTSADDLIRPLSPTSSLKGIYVRSRPTSMDVSADYLDFDFGGFYQAAFSRTVVDGDQSTDHSFHAHSLPGFILSNDSGPIFTPATSGHVSSDATSVYTDEEYIQKNAARRTAETLARVKALNENHARARKYYAESISPSVKTTASKNTVISLGRKGEGATCQNIEEGDELASTSEPMKDQTRAQKERTSIPLVHRVTQKVYGVFHRKTHSTPEAIQVGSSLLDNSINDGSVEDPKPAEAIKSSSISLFTRKRRSTTSSQQEPPQWRPKNIFSQRALSIQRNKTSFPATPNTVSLTSTSLAIENRAARLRRSVSFAGFIDLPELDNDLDEATAEATLVANKTSVMARWANLQGRRGCDSDGVDNGYIFERNVE